MDKRVKFDFEIYFTNGGSIKGEDFRLDIAGDHISDKELADYIVADLRLLMVGQTKILNKEISININQGNIKQILSKIQSEANVNFVYSASMIKADRHTTVNAVKKRLGDILDETLTPLKIFYRVVDNTILLSDKAHIDDKTDLPAGFTDLGQMVIKGKVSTTKGEPIPGVSVKVKGKGVGVMTDVNGNYTITIPDAEAVLVFTYIGFVTKEIAGLIKSRRKLSAIFKPFVSFHLSCFYIIHMSWFIFFYINNLF